MGLMWGPLTPQPPPAVALHSGDNKPLAAGQSIMTALLLQTGNSSPPSLSIGSGGGSHEPGLDCRNTPDPLQQKGKSSRQTREIEIRKQTDTNTVIQIRLKKGKFVPLTGVDPVN